MTPQTKTKSLKKKITSFFEMRFAPYVLLFVLAFVVFINSISGPFLLDDFSLVVNNESIQSLSNYGDWYLSDRLAGSGFTSNFYRPFAATVHAFMYAIFELDHIPYHLLNILIHALSGCVAYILLIRLSFSRLLAFFGAALFIVHPVQSESVAYVSGLPDVLSGLLILSTLAVFLNDGKDSKDRMLARILTVLALLTKESAVIIFPLALLLFSFTKAEGDRKKYQINLLKSIGVITAVYILLRFTLLDFSTSGILNSATETGGEGYRENVLVRLSALPGIIIEYLILIFAPLKLHSIREFSEVKGVVSVKGVLGLITLIISLYYAIKNYKNSNKVNKPYIFLGVLFFLLALIPVYGIFVLNTPYSERFLYVALIGVISLILFGITQLNLKKTQSLIVVVLILLVVGLSARTIDRNNDYTSTINFYENELMFSPESARVNHELGVAYYLDGDIEKGIALYKKAIEIKPDFSYAYFNLANAYMNTYQANPERLELGMDAYFSSIQYNPNLGESYAALFQIYYHILKDREKATVLREMIDRLDAGEEIAFEELEVVR